MANSSIIDICKKYKDRFIEVSNYLEYPEFNVDYNFAKRYYAELNELTPIVNLYDEYLKTESDECLQRIVALINKNVFDNYDGIDIFVDEEFLYNFYFNYFLTAKYKVENIKDGIRVYGVNLYCIYKMESGMHEIITKSGNKAYKVLVLPYIENKEIELKDKDVKIDYYHSQGAGGQNINKVESAIRMTHIETGLVVTCQDERSQLQNKNKAFELLKDKVEKFYIKENAKEIEKAKSNFKKKTIRQYNIEKDELLDLRINKTYSIDEAKRYKLQQIDNEIIINGAR